MKLILGGFLLVTTGTILPFLMASRLIEPSFPLAFLSCVASLSGLAFGIGVLVSCVSSRADGHRQDDGRVIGAVGSRTSCREY